jgi:uncharacterized protein (TIGR03437 family)
VSTSTKIRAFVLSLACAGYGFAQTPAVFSGGVLNGASFVKGQPVTPGSLVSIFGTNLASQVAQADTIPLSNSLGGVTVEFVNGDTTMNAPMLYVQPDDPTHNVTSQLNVQVPWELVPNGTTANVDVIVTNNGVSSPPTQFTVAPFSPGVFASNGLAIAVNSSDGTLAWPAGAVPGLTTHPAKIGDVIIVYATGLGAVANPPADGQNSLDQLRNNLVPPQVMIGGISAEVPFAGLSPQFVGVNQLNVKIPNVTPGNSVPLQVQLGGITSPASVTIAVSQ